MRPNAAKHSLLLGNVLAVHVTLLSVVVLNAVVSHVGSLAFVVPAVVHSK